MNTEPKVLEYGNQKEAISQLYREADKETPVVVCCYGDPTVSDEEYIRRWRDGGFTVRIVPGVSSVQVARSRAGITAEDSHFFTFHRRGDIVAEQQEFLETVRAGNRHAIALPHPGDFMPGSMAAWLLDHGIDGNRRVVIYESLTLPDESSHELMIRDLSRRTDLYHHLSIVIVFSDQNNDT